MSISYIYISFINIKTCDKYDASSSVNEQIKTYILTFLLKRTAVKMPVCLTRFRSKGSLIICEIRNIDHVRVYHGISFIQSKTTISIMETCIYSYGYLSISNIYLSVYLYVCMHVCMHIYMDVCMYVSIYLSVCLYTYIYIYRFIFSPPKNKRQYKKYF